MFIESVLGEAVRFQPKKELTLLPGVSGFLASMAVIDFIDDEESILNGGGLIAGFNAMSTS